MTSISQQQLFSKFRVIRVLGEGSFGKVFLIRNIHTCNNLQMLDEEYAMKKYSKYHLAKNGKQLSLVRSVRILKNLSNSGIIDFIYFVYGKEDEIFLIFQACKKGSLEDVKNVLFKDKAQDLIKQIMFQLAKCLEYLKSVSVAHRDIKPSNIAFNSKGQLKIIDFDEAVCFREDVINNQVGFSQQFSEEIVDIRLTARRSRANSYVGTEKYMSPQMKQRTGTDERGDIWAFGCILYELVSGEFFMIEPEEEEEMEAKVSYFLMKMKDLDPLIVDLLSKILVLNPNKRYTIEEILAHHYFDEYHKYQFQNKKKLKKFLRGNYNLMDPRTVIDALKMDLIGMKAGDQIFQILNIPIFLERKSSFWEKLFQIQMPSTHILVGGGRYFKLKHPVEEDKKIYIFYDQIDNIRIQDDFIEIRCSTEKKSLKSGVVRKEKTKNTEECYRIKHLLSDQMGRNYLGRLFEALLYIWYD